MIKWFKPSLSYILLLNLLKILLIDSMLLNMFKPMRNLNLWEI